MDAATTLIHLCAMNRQLPVAYNILVLTATLTSYTWHTSGERDRTAGILDLGLAALWAATDAVLLPATIPLNLLVAALFLAMENHAAWHCVSAAKAAIVSQMLIHR
jgi:hypothetical protein